ncbi:hypothetical protein TRFO_10440 [Tritrichomonas foetus]|uniref:Uncharacterized protein n=1 Tax=Tritrichomonas foetus TaxID=1144522 RepID=A0A1J4J8P2_9EUKA|nr:hypothetical protein TRFO_10440 [Tritrichomonas foetus]|eukprot:OHS95550.1 hypothetical protein TRFO_10440 [Tritrichomonas foetus]
MERNLDSRSKEDLQKALSNLREQNRDISTQNRIIREQIRLIELKTGNLRKDFSEQKDEIDASHARTIKQLEDLEEGKNSERKANKRKLLREIKDKTEENRQLEDQIRNLNQQILHFKKVNENLPPKTNVLKRTATKKTAVVTTKTSINKTNRTTINATKTTANAKKKDPIRKAPKKLI